MWNPAKQLITAPARNEYAAGEWRDPLFAIVAVLNRTIVRVIRA